MRYKKTSHSCRITCERAHKHTHTHTRTHARAQARAHTHARTHAPPPHTHTHSHTHTHCLPVGIDSERQNLSHLSRADGADSLTDDGGLATTVLPDQHQGTTRVCQHPDQVQQLLWKPRHKMMQGQFYFNCVSVCYGGCVCVTVPQCVCVCVCVCVMVCVCVCV